MSADEQKTWEEFDLFPAAESFERAIHAIANENYDEARSHIQNGSCEPEITEDEHELLDEAFDFVGEDDEEAIDLLNRVCDGLDGAGLYFKSGLIA